MKDNCLIIFYIKIYPCNFRSSSSDDDDDQCEGSMSTQLQNSTRMINKVIMDHMAYIRACAKRKKYDLDKHKNNIRKEMKSKIATCKTSATHKGTDGCS